MVRRFSRRGRPRARPRTRTLRRRFVRRSRRAMPRALGRMTVYRHTLKEPVQNLSLNGTSGSVGAFAFRLGNCLESAAYTRMYDQYRIRGVRITFHPNNQTPTGGTPIFFYYYVDLNDVNAPVNPDVLYAMQGCKSFNVLSKNLVGRTKSLFLRPKVNFEVYEGPVSTAYAVAGNPWLMTAEDNIPYFGFKWAVPSFGSATTTIMSYEVKYWIEFRAVQPAAIE